jgi:hypothetical protein
MRNEELIEKLLKGELSVSEIKELEAVFDLVETFNFRPLIRRIFDLNEGPVQNNSTASFGIFGWLNKRGRKRKNRKFRKLVKKGTLDKIIVAEGDSWFEFPLFIRDIIDWIIQSNRYAVYSIASGGDWIGNILYSGEYISELSIYLPDAFLISGGGNDLVGGNRLAILIRRRKDIKLDLKPSDKILLDFLASSGETTVNSKRIIIGRKFLNKDFWALLNAIRFQYYLIFKSIRSANKLDHMKIITQGYDYPVPSSNKNIFRNPLRIFIGNGQWLDTPMKIRGVVDQEEKNSIITAMIYEFNMMMIDVGKKFSDTYHIDCRGVAQENDWADELHLKSKQYRMIAEKYVECIESTDPNKKVFKVKY